MKRLLTLLFSLAIVIIAHAQVPGTLSYQGILVNSSGEPVNDGVHSVQFKFYDALTGGALVDDTAPIIVTTYKGLFTTTIGSGETGNEALTSDVMNAAYLGNKAIFVEIVADGTTLSPRVRLTSTINALHAHNANNATNASTMPASGLTGSANLPNTVLDTDLQDLADGVLSVERGGTGATAITGVFIGNGTNAATSVSATGAGQFFRRNAADTGYEFIDLSASNGLTVTDGNLSLGGTLTENTTLSTDGFNMEINGLGKVGIGTGTNDPLNKLDVGGSMSVGNAYAGTETAPVNGLIVQGNVGIGTAAPTQRLDIRGGSTDDGGVMTMGNLDNSHFLSLFSGRESDALPYFAWAPSDPLRFVTYNSADFTGFAEHMRISAAGRIGIGTTTPANRLDVEGAAAIGANYSGSSTAPANGAIIEGNVGIGTNAPSSKLDVRGQLTLDADNSWVTGGVRFRNSSNVLDGGVIQTLSGALFYRSPSGDGQLGHRFYNGGSASEIMTLLNNGNLGLGTTTPAARLDVNGTSVFRGYTGINRTSAITTSSVFDVEATTVAGGFGGMYVNGTNATSFPFYGYSTAGAAKAYHYVDGGTNIWHLNNGGNRLSVSNTGLVGIGATAVNRLDVEGGAVIGATYSGTNTAPTNGLLVEGNVGIGTTAPVTLLHTDKAGSGNYHRFSEGGTLRGLIGVAGQANDLIGGDVDNDFGIRSESNMLFGAGSSERMRITSAGNVGIGTITPANRLDVEGGVAIGATYSGTNAAPTNGLLVQGNVGIATTTLNTAARLTVNGPVFSSDANDYLVADGDAFQFSHVNTGGTTFTERVRINSLGNVGIGTASPNSRLDVEGGTVIGATYSGTTAAPTNGLLVEGNVGIGLTAPGTNKLYVSVPSTDATNPVGLRIDNNYTGGSVKYGIDVNVDGAGSGSKYGISSSVVGLAGDASANYGYQVTMTPNGTGTVTGIYSVIGNNGTGARYGVFSSLSQASGNASSVFGLYSSISDLGTGNAYGVYSTGEDFNYFSGNVGIGTTIPAFPLEVVGNAAKSGGGTSWTTTSDRRVKTDIQSVENGIETIKKLRPVKFRYNDEWLRKYPAIGNRPYYSFIAQEFQTVFPESVSGSGKFLEGDSEEILTIDISNVHIVAVKAIQEQQAQIEELQATVSALKRQLAETQAISAQVQDLKRQLGQVQQLSAQVEELKKMVTQQAATTAAGNDKK